MEDLPTKSRLDRQIEKTEEELSSHRKHLFFGEITVFLLSLLITFMTKPTFLIFSLFFSSCSFVYLLYYFILSDYAGKRKKLKQLEAQRREEVAATDMGKPPSEEATVVEVVEEDFSKESKLEAELDKLELEEDEEI